MMKAKHVCDIPASAGKMVTMCTWGESIVIACEYGVFMYDDVHLKLIEIFAIKRPHDAGIPV